MAPARAVGAGACESAAGAPGHAPKYKHRRRPRRAAPARNSQCSVPLLRASFSVEAALRMLVPTLEPPGLCVNIAIIAIMNINAVVSLHSTRPAPSAVAISLRKRCQSSTSWGHPCEVHCTGSVLLGKGQTAETIVKVVVPRALMLRMKLILAPPPALVAAWAQPCVCGIEGLFIATTIHDANH